MTVCRTFCPEPKPDTLFCIRKYAGDTLCQPVIAEMYFFLYRICFLYDGNFKYTGFGFHGNQCQKCHAQGDIKIKCVDCSKLSYAKVFKLEPLPFTTEIFFYFPKGKIDSSYFDYILFGFETDNVILSQFIRFQKHLVIIETPIHGKGCFSKE